MFLLIFCSEQFGKGRNGSGKEWGISFLRSPVEILSSATERVDCMKLEINTLEVRGRLRGSIIYHSTGTQVPPLMFTLWMHVHTKCK